MSVVERFTLVDVVTTGRRQRGYNRHSLRGQHSSMVGNGWRMNWLPSELQNATYSNSLNLTYGILTKILNSVNARGWFQRLGSPLDREIEVPE